MADRSLHGTARELTAVLSRLRRRLIEISDHQGLTGPQASVLGRLSKLGPMSASQLAAIERVRPQSVAATVHRLLDLGLVRREPDPVDGRRQVLSLTDAGGDRLGGSRHSREEWLVGRLEGLSAAEVAVLDEALVLMARLADS